MKSKDFYEVIGNINEDLINEAAEPVKKQKGKVYFLPTALAAACLVLILGIGGFLLPQNKIVINKLEMPYTAKIAVPENAESKMISYTELLGYFGIEKLPDTIIGELIKEDRDTFFIYEDKSGNVVMDVTNVYYNTTEKDKALSLTLSKVSDVNADDENAEISDIEGCEAALFSAGESIYSADFEINGVNIEILTRGLNESEFINAVSEIIKSLK